MSRPDLRIIEGGGDPTLINNPELKAAVVSDEVSANIQVAIADLAGIAEYALPHMSSHVVHPSVSRPPGTLFRKSFKGGDKKVYQLVVDAAFPGALHADGEPPMGASEAMGFAATYIRAFEVMHRAIKFGLMKNVISGKGLLADIDPSLWPPMWDRNQEATAYRAAGTICLAAASMERFTILTTQQNGYPPHIAGLINPLSVRGSGGFSNTRFSDLRIAIAEHARYLERDGDE